MRRIHPRTPAWRLFGTALVLLALAEAGAAQETSAPSVPVEAERASRAAEFERLLPMLGDPITADDALCAIRDLGAPVVALLRQELGATTGEALPVPVLIRHLPLRDARPLDAIVSVAHSAGSSLTFAHHWQRIGEL